MSTFTNSSWLNSCKSSMVSPTSIYNFLIMRWQKMPSTQGGFM
ncbi:MAG: hypothetical protein ACRCW1_04915 [Anaerotignaceae bacterium]